MKLFGTSTSPFVRRIRIIATELGVAYERVDTATEAGQAALRAVTPIWKVPAAVVDDVVLFDSRNISEYLVAQNGWGPLRAPDASERWQQQNLLNVIDAVQDSGINLFYLERDGVDVSAAPYLQRQRARVESSLLWLEGALRGPSFSADGRLGLPEIALITALDWLTFRERYDVGVHPGLVAFRDAHQDRASIQATYPAA